QAQLLLNNHLELELVDLAVGIDGVLQALWRDTVAIIRQIDCPGSKVYGKGQQARQQIKQQAYTIENSDFRVDLATDLAPALRVEKGSAGGELAGQGGSQEYCCKGLEAHVGISHPVAEQVCAPGIIARQAASPGYNSAFAQ